MEEALALPCLNVAPSSQCSASTSGEDKQETRPVTDPQRNLRVDDDPALTKEGKAANRAIATGGPGRNVKHPTNDLETMVHLLKGNIGSGSLALPEAFMHSGLWIGLVGTPIIGALCTHCMHILLHSSRELCRRTGIASLSYEETAEMSFKHGPQSFQRHSKTFLYVITSFLVVTQLGFCCVYFVFVSQNLYQALECMTGGTNLSQFNYLTFLLLPVLLICYIPDLKYLAPVSILASLLQLIGLLFTFYYLLRDLPVVEERSPVPLSQLPLFFGTALYAFEAIGLVLPLENNMKKPDNFPGWTGVLNTGMSLVIFIYCAIGFYGYLRYGDKVLGSITLNLPGNEVLAQTVKILMSVAIFLTYPLQYYVALSIMLPSVRGKFASKKAKFVAEYVFRSLLVFLTFILAALIPNVGLFINLIGAICSSALALVFPPLIDSVTLWPKTGKYNWKIYKNVFIAALGLIGFLTGSYSSFVALIDFYQIGDHSIATGC